MDCKGLGSQTIHDVQLTCLFKLDSVHHLFLGSNTLLSITYCIVAMVVAGCEDSEVRFCWSGIFPSVSIWKQQFPDNMVGDYPIMQNKQTCVPRLSNQQRCVVLK